jgi:hypothetical protein
MIWSCVIQITTEWCALSQNTAVRKIYFSPTPLHMMHKPYCLFISKILQITSDSCIHRGGLWYGASVRGKKCHDVYDGRTAVLYHFSTYHELKEMCDNQPQHTKKRAKHRDHGGRAALFSINVELMVLHDRTCGRPIHGVGRGRGRSNTVLNDKI